MRLSFVALGLVALTAGAVPARAQFLSFDARSIGMAGMSLTRDGDLRRYNPAYRAVPRLPDQSRFVIPIPLGIIQAIQDSNITFNTKDSNFNALAIANLVLNPPIFYQLSKPTPPKNDISITIGLDSLRVGLGAMGGYIPADGFTYGGVSRLIDIGLPTIKGVRLSVYGLLDLKVNATPGPTLLGFLRDSVYAVPADTYAILSNDHGVGGFVPSLGWSGRISGDSDNGVYVGAAVHRYFGVAMAQNSGNVGIVTSNPVLGATPAFVGVDTFSYQKPSSHFAGGFGVDLGAVVVRGPLEFGLGLNDVGNKLTWDSVWVETIHYDSATNKFKTDTIAPGNASLVTKIPVTWIANVAYQTGGAVIGANIVNTGQGVSVHAGAEKRLGVLAVRGGLARDNRGKLQFGWGGGLRAGFLELDVGFETVSYSLSDQRGLQMATSLTIY